jgi:hypothetical protein
MAQTGRTKVKGVKKSEISYEELSYLYLLMGKAAKQKKREREAQEKAKRRERRK